MNTLANQIADKFIEVTTELRMLEGINEAAYQDLILYLKEYIEQDANNECVPKIMAQVFFDNAGFLESVAHMYTGDIAKRIINMSDELEDLIREILTPRVSSV